MPGRNPDNGRLPTPPTWREVAAPPGRRRAIVLLLCVVVLAAVTAVSDVAPDWSACAAYAAVCALAAVVALAAAHTFFLPMVEGMREAEQEDRRRRGKCLACGYLLKGNVSGVCPECGGRRSAE